MGQPAVVKTGRELEQGDRVMFPKGVTKTIRSVTEKDFGGAFSVDVLFTDDSLTNYGEVEIVKVAAPLAADGNGASKPKRTRTQRATGAKPAEPEQPAKRTRRSVEQVEKEAFQRGIQAGIERAAKLSALNGEADKELSRLQEAVESSMMGQPAALASAFALGQEYQKARDALDNA